MADFRRYLVHIADILSNNRMNNKGLTRLVTQKYLTQTTFHPQSALLYSVGLQSSSALSPNPTSYCPLTRPPYCSRGVTVPPSSSLCRTPAPPPFPRALPPPSAQYWREAGASSSARPTAPRCSGTSTRRTSSGADILRESGPPPAPRLLLSSPPPCPRRPWGSSPSSGAARPRP